jgi:membrane protein implicated in regulation of membrane protease activity
MMAQGHLTTLTLLIFSFLVNLNECFRYRRDVEAYMDSHLSAYELVESSGISVSDFDDDKLTLHLHTKVWQLYCSSTLKVTMDIGSHHIDSSIP